MTETTKPGAVNRAKPAKTDILSITGAYVRLKQQGKNYTGLCPFHYETTPSFTVDSSSQTFLCLGCGAQGSAEDFVRMLEKQQGVCDA